jgi:hypothetical protein
VTLSVVMLSVIYAECHIKPFMVSVIVLNVVMLSVLELEYMVMLVPNITPFLLVKQPRIHIQITKLYFLRNLRMRPIS